MSSSVELVLLYLSVARVSLRVLVCVCVWCLWPKPMFDRFVDVM